MFRKIGFPTLLGCMYHVTGTTQNWWVRRLKVLTCYRAQSERIRVLTIFNLQTFPVAKSHVHV